MNCPLCLTDSTQIAFSAKGYDILDCRACGHRFADISADEDHVNAVYGDDYFLGGGAGYDDYTAESDLLIKRGRHYADRLKRHATAGTMLDVGAAAGFILKGFVDNGWQGVGIEPNGSMVKFGKEQLGLKMRQGSLESFAGEEKFDLISMIQVVAHFYEPRTAFQKAAKLLNKNGLLLIETWERESFAAKIFGKNWHEYSPPSVLQWYSQKGLTDFLHQFGFNKIDGRRTIKKISGRHARSLLEYRLGKNALLDLIPQKLAIPFPSDDLFWALYKLDG